MHQIKHTLDFPPFRARAPWWGGDLQTLRNAVLGDRGKLPGRTTRMSFETSDGSGDRLLASLDEPDGAASGPLIVLVHGLTGCEDSTYIRETARFHLERGRRVLRINMRGAGPSKATCRHYYHAGRASDIHDILSGLNETLSVGGFFTVGYSLGGNILLNFIARHQDQHKLVGAVSVSAPIVPADASRRIMERRNWFYHRWLLARMKEDCLGLSGKLTAEEETAIRNARSVRAFDNDFIAPRNGFAGADDYYARTASFNVIRDIRIPTLLIHAENDPWIPSGPYRKLQQNCPTDVSIIVSEGGGHVGFHGAKLHYPWHDFLIERFAKSLSV